MKSAIVAALLCCLLASPSATRAQPSRPLGAIELAGAIAACMTYARSYPIGGGIVAHGTIYEAGLEENGEFFATIAQSADGKSLTIGLVPAEFAESDQQWARERARYAMHCYDSERTRLLALP